MNLTPKQKQMALARRRLYYVELGRVLWHRERLLEELQVPFQVPNPQPND